MVDRVFNVVAHVNNNKRQQSVPVVPLGGSTSHTVRLELGPLGPLRSMCRWWPTLGEVVTAMLASAGVPHPSLYSRRVGMGDHSSGAMLVWTRSS